MYRDIYVYEKHWLEKMLDIEFKGKSVLLRQLLNAKVILEQGYDFISLKFKIEGTEKYPYPVRVPVEMRTFNENTAPIVFLLHIINGFIDELEVITADSSRIDIEIIEFDKVEYVINENVMMM